MLMSWPAHFSVSDIILQTSAMWSPFITLFFILFPNFLILKLRNIFKAASLPTITIFMISCISLDLRQKQIQ